MIHKAPVHKPQALVIEDDPAIAKEVANILKSLDHGYDFAVDQKTARQRIDNQPIETGS
ncbi:MAG: hypothetical protein FWD61_00895 [Phycisphaerales bacterium]|nr:hypothetical protein [Phycisphaerales bacterium]